MEGNTKPVREIKYIYPKPTISLHLEKKTWFVIYGPSGDRDRKNHCRYQNLCWWANLMKTSGLILYSSDPVRDAEWVSSGPLAPTVPPDPPPPPAPHIQMMVWLMKSGSLTRSKVGFNRELATISRTNIRMGDAVKSSWKYTQLGFKQYSPENGHNHKNRNFNLIEKSEI